MRSDIERGMDIGSSRGEVKSSLEAKPRAEPAWGVDSEYGRLLDVLLCPPDNFRWLPTSAISRATLDSGLLFDRETALSQHAEMVSAYEEAGVRVHFLEADRALPYQVFARDSSVMTPGGPIVTQCAQWWRRGEYAPVIHFYEQCDIAIWKMVTAGSMEGGDFMVVEPGCAVIGTGEERTQEPAARQVAGWLGGADRANPAPLPAHRRPGVHARGEARGGLPGAGLDRLCALARVEAGRDRPRDAGGGAEARSERSLPGGRARALDRRVEGPQPAAAGAGPDRLRARVVCIHARWRRRALPDAGPAPGAGRLTQLDSRRVIADLRELNRVTGGADGARRVCWTPEWERARALLRERLGEIEGVAVEEDEAANLWATLPGDLPPAVAVGSHLDSVPHGGWLDGALGVMAGLEVLRSAAAEAPRHAVTLIDFADEEGARFGRSLFGSSAVAGTLD